MPLIIVADDLTGAADSAARCFHAGLTADIYLAPTAEALLGGAAAFSTDSRYLSPEAAGQQVSAVISALSISPPVTWYKKIDSTLRGNIGAELDVMLKLLTPPGAQSCAVICPAFPAQGRGLVDGYLAHAATPARTLHLPTILADQTARPLVAIALADVRVGVTQIAAQLTQAQQAGIELFVVDAMEEADLDLLLAATRLALPHALLCGSAGLIEPLARAYAAQTGQMRPVADSPIVLRRPVLGVIGSGSAMAHRQIDALRSAAEVCFVTVRPGMDNLGLDEELAGQNGDWIVHLPKPGAADVLEGAAARQWVAALTTVAERMVHYLQPGALIIVGGDTAVHLLSDLGIVRLTVLAELMPGIPLLLGVDRAGRGWQIITKAGNFGDEATLIKLFHLAR